MSLSPDQPMTRRAAREARIAATGEVPPSPAEAPDGASRPAAFGSGPFVAGPFVPPTSAEDVAVTGEAPAASGLVGPDGQVMSRRRLREQRTQAIATIDLTATGEATAESTGEAAAEPVAAEPESIPAPPPAAEAPESEAPASEAPEGAAAEAPETGTTPTDTVPADTTPAPEPAPWTAPEGHWTRQLAESEDSGDLTGSREVGGSPQGTSSTIVVDHPAVMDLGGPLDATGEVLLTGSIPLSHDFARTGAMGSVTGAELDDRFDQEFAASPDAQPVRASAVASQHALGSPIVANATRRGGRGMTVLLVTASVLAVLVTGLVVTAIVLGWFGH